MLALTAGSRGDGLIVIERPLMPGDPHPGLTPLRVAHHHVTVDIKDQIAATHVDQVFINPTGQRLEGTYLFPLPAGAQIDKFTMDVNGQTMAAELLDADKARGIYEAIVRQARDPALLEYVGQGAIKVRIFPIEPNERKHITLSYTQLLQRDNGALAYTYPLNTEKFSSAPIASVAVTVNLQTTQPLKTVYSPSHAVEVQRGGPRRATIGWEVKDARPDTDFQLLFADAADEKAVALSVLSETDGDRGYFLLLASPGLWSAAAPVVNKDVVFVLDTSGSMSGGKLEQAKRAVRFCLENLNEGDRFEVVRFSTEAEPFFGALRPATKTHCAQAAEFVEDFKPTGGTAIHDALQSALRTLRGMGEEAELRSRGPGRPAYVIFMTDGLPTTGNTNPADILKLADPAAGAEPARRTIRVFTFGIGADVNTHLLDKLAEKSRGSNEYVLPGEDIEVKVSRYYERIATPVLTDLALDFAGEVRVSKLHPGIAPGSLPDLFKGEQLVVLGAYRGGGKAALTLSGKSNGEPKSFTQEVRFAGADENEKLPGAGAGAGVIARLWATRRVGYLLDEIRLHGDQPELRDEVVQLARRFGIVTPYTSYLIVEDEARRDVPLAMQTLSELQRDGVARGRAGDFFRESNDATSGAAAVGGSMMNKALKNSAVAAPPSSTAAPVTTEPLRALGLEQAAALPTQSVRVVRNQAFYQNGRQWVDARVQALSKDAKVVPVAFNSDAYFALIRKHPDAAAWLSLGDHLQLVLDGVVYEITPAIPNEG
jgi:Ca-activated chloride channel family protein